jgi:hypothetical protein
VQRRVLTLGREGVVEGVARKVDAGEAGQQAQAAFQADVAVVLGQLAGGLLPRGRDDDAVEDVVIDPGVGAGGQIARRG